MYNVRMANVTVTASEWGVSYTSPADHETGGVCLNVYRIVDEPNQWGGRGVVIQHSEHDGRVFPDIDMARAYALEAGLVKLFIRTRT